jgi:hypothetical protein
VNMKDQASKPFPDKDRKLVEERLASGNWKCCVSCDWFYNQLALDKCPLCHYAWKNGSRYKQPKYESPSLS